MRAREVLGERHGFDVGRVGVVLAGHDLDFGNTLGEPQRGLEGVGEPALDAAAAHEPVDDHLDRVVLVPGETAAAAEIDELAVDPGPGVALLRQLLEHPLVLALPAPHNGREHLESGAFRQLEDAVDDLLRGLARDHPSAVGAVRHADAGIEKAEVVVDLGDRADRGPRVPRRRLLVDRDRRRQALDEVDVGLVHLPEELAGVGRQRFDIATLTLRIDRVERQRRLPRTREPGEDDQLVARQLDIDVAQVVLARSTDPDRPTHSRPGYPLGASSNGCSEAKNSDGAVASRATHTARTAWVFWREWTSSKSHTRPVRFVDPKTMVSVSIRPGIESSVA